MNDSHDVAARALIVRAYELLDGGLLDLLDEVYTEDVEMVTPDEHLRGLGEVGALFLAIRAAFPDIAHELVNVVTEDDRVAAEWVVRATHTGPLTTPDGDLPPTGRRIEIALAEFGAIRDGRIARSVSYWTALDSPRSSGRTSLLGQPERALSLRRHEARGGAPHDPGVSERSFDASSVRERTPNLR